MSISSEQYHKSKKARNGKTMSRRAAKRDQSEPEIVEALRAFGFSVFRLDEPVDLMVGFRGRMWLVECKTGSRGYGASLNDNQAAFADEWRGPEIVVLRDQSSAIEWASSVARRESAVAVYEANVIQDALDCFLDAYGEALKTNDSDRWVDAGRLFGAYTRARDGGAS
jgi:hypothetical protein